MSLQIQAYVMCDQPGCKAEAFAGTRDYDDGATISMLLALKHVRKTAPLWRAEQDGWKTRHFCPEHSGLKEEK